MTKAEPQPPGGPATAALSNIGASGRRTVLEDRCRAGRIETAAGLDLTVGLVADGIGGENAGERAAELTVTVVFDHIARSAERNIPLLLKRALEEANRRVFADARGSRRKSNMGSTAALAAIADNRLYVANVGDSRIYLLRDGKAACVTRDHTWEEEIVRSGRLSPQEAAKHPRKDEIVRSIGYDRSLQVDLGLWLRGGKESQAEAEGAQGLPLQQGDVVLVCSDGLIKTRHNNPAAHYVEEHELAPLAQGRPPKEAANRLVRRALAGKADDNVSAVVLQIPGGQRARRRLNPIVFAWAGLALALVGAGYFLPKILHSGGGRGTPTIPPLPSGVAYVSEVVGNAEFQQGSSGFRPLRAEEIVAAGTGAVLRTLGPDAYIRVGLADQSIMYIGPNSEIELLAIADGSQVRETVIVLRRGIVLASTEAGPLHTLAVKSPAGDTARLLGSLMGVIFDELLPRFDVDCFHERCEISRQGSGRLPIVLSRGQHAWMDAEGVVSPPDATRSEPYSFANYGGGLVPTPTSVTGGQGVILGATATRISGSPIWVPPTVLPPTPTPTRPSAPEPSDTPVPTEPPPTDTPEPTNPPRPSRTPRPTHTEVPPPTETPETLPTETPGPTAE